MTAAAVPDHRFRDQLAEALVRLWGYEPDDVDPVVAAYDATDALMPTITAEVEARVQAAANQRAAEALEEAAEERLMPSNGSIICRANAAAYRSEVAAALASAAPAPRTEEGQR